MVEELNDVNMKEFIGKHKVCVVDFYADWCGPCKMLKPVFEELAHEMKGKASFGKMNVDQNRQSPGSYGVMSMPTLIIFSDGKMVDRMVGAYPKEIIKQRIMKFVG
jgi:thioredoxin 1